MRRFSTAAAAAILLFTANSFAGYDAWTCAETHALKSVSLQCVSCGIQSYYRSAGKGEVVPAEKWLFTLGASARVFRGLNPGEASDNSVTDIRARINLQKTVISQIQAYNFCTNKYDNPKELDSIRKYITHSTNLEMSDLAKTLGFKGGKIFGSSAEDNYKLLLEYKVVTDKNGKVDDPNFYSIGEKRSLFRANAKDIISRNGADDGLSDCMKEAMNRQSMPDAESYKFCREMASACDITETDFCLTKGMVVQKGGGSGSSSQGQPKPATQQQNRLAPPPPAYAPVQ